MKPVCLLFCFAVLCCCMDLCVAQTGLGASEGRRGQDSPAVESSARAGSGIVVPAATSTKVEFRKTAKKGRLDLAAWLREESANNGLESSDLLPWHAVIAYDQFDEDGDNVNSGVYEEFWAGPRKYRRSYKSDNFNQSDYATGRGLFRQGDQRWAKTVEMQVRQEILEPFYYAETLQGFNARGVDRSFGGHKLRCVLLERDSIIASEPTQYCFDPEGSVLRYTRGSGWFQTTYNDIISFQGRNLAHQVEVRDGGKPYLKLTVKTIELISHPEDQDYQPPNDAVVLSGKRVSGVNLRPVSTGDFPALPKSLRGQYITVEVAVVIGKDGTVTSAHATSGPEEARKPCENEARRWRYSPYLVLGEAVEVETTIRFDFR